MSSKGGLQILMAKQELSLKSPLLTVSITLAPELMAVVSPQGPIPCWPIQAYKPLTP